MLLSIIPLIGLLPCILADSYDKQTLLESSSSHANPETAQIREAFARLNEILVESHYETLEEDSLGQKVARAIEIINANAATIDRQHLGSSSSEAIEILDSLDRVTTWCDLAGYRVLVGAYTASTPVDPDAASPIHELAIEALARHGQACRPQYSQRFPQIAQEMEPAERVLAGKVDKLLSADLIDLLFPGEDLKSRVRAVDIVPDRFVAHVSRPLFMDKLNEAARRTADRIKRPDGDLSARDLERHLVEPCQIYVQSYDDIFLPARLDLALNEDKITQINPTKSEKFTQAWMKFRVCSALLEASSQEALELINQKLSNNI